ncbi:hypothetical protein WMY93_005651 [Mugilogobius chulae]|uniref:Uncharacterized protein n=1 Tax=Mugilogobius chulae TaxID=88201 RepID=A0AAW0PK70_9GOBI
MASTSTKLRPHKSTQTHRRAVRLIGSEKGQPGVGDLCDLSHPLHRADDRCVCVCAWNTTSLTSGAEREVSGTSESSSPGRGLQEAGRCPRKLRCASEGRAEIAPTSPQR